MLSTGAFNALLKTLEEPTIRMWSLFWPLLNCTRFLPLFYPVCNVLNLKSIKTQDIKEHIHYILEKENISSEPEAVEIIVQTG